MGPLNLDLNHFLYYLGTISKLFGNAIQLNYLDPACVGLKNDSSDMGTFLHKVRKGALSIYALPYNLRADVIRSLVKRRDVLTRSRMFST